MTKPDSTPSEHRNSKPSAERCCEADESSAESSGCPEPQAPKMSGPERRWRSSMEQQLQQAAQQEEQEQAQLCIGWANGWLER